MLSHCRPLARKFLPAGVLLVLRSHARVGHMPQSTACRRSAASIVAERVHCTHTVGQFSKSAPHYEAPGRSHYHVPLHAVPSSATAPSLSESPAHEETFEPCSERDYAISEAGRANCEDQNFDPIVISLVNCDLHRHIEIL